MSLPVGVTAATVTWGSLVDFFGEGAKVSVTVTPVLGGNAKSIAWVATGQSLVKFSSDVSAAADTPASWVSPHVDQAGFRDGSGNAFTMWSYKAEATVRKGNQIETLTKVYQPLVGQDVIDLDLVPDGSIASPSSAPTATVTSFAGQTGAITIASVSADIFSAIEGDVDTKIGSVAAGEKAAIARSLGAHLFADYQAGIYERDGVTVAQSSVLTHDTPTGRPFMDCAPFTANKLPAVSGGVMGIIGSGGALPTGWSMVNASASPVTVVHVGDGGLDLELSFSLPAGATVGFTSPALTATNDTHHINSYIDVAATDLSSIETRVGWNTESGINALVQGGGIGDQITLKFAGSSIATDKLFYRLTNTSTVDAQVRWLVKNACLYVPAVDSERRRDNQPTVVADGTQSARDVTVMAAPGTYVLLAWTDRGVAPARVVVASGATSFSLRSAIGNAKVFRVVAWRAADYRDGMSDALEAPAWEGVGQFDTVKLANTSELIYSTSKMRIQGPGRPWNLAVAPNRFMRSRVEVRPGDFIERDTSTGVAVEESIYKRRSEVLSNTPVPFDTDIWQSFGFRTNALMPDPDAYGIIAQWLATPNGGESLILSPEMSIQLRQNAQFGIFTASTSDPNPATQPPYTLRWLGTYVPGKWHRLVLRMRFSQSGGGKLGIWFDGQEMYAYQDTPLGYNKTVGPKPHFGYYGAQSKETIVVDRANMEFGTRDLSSRILSPLPI